MPDNVTYLTDLTDQLAVDARALRRIAERPEYNTGMVTIGRDLNAIAETMELFRKPMLKSLDAMTFARMTGRVLFDGKPTRWTPPGTAIDTNGLFASWNRAVRSASETAASHRRILSGINPPTWSDDLRRAALVGLARQVRQLVADTGENPDDTVAVNLATRAVCEAAGMPIPDGF